VSGKVNTHFCRIPGIRRILWWMWWVWDCWRSDNSIFYKYFISM